MQKLPQKRAKAEEEDSRSKTPIAKKTRESKPDFRPLYLEHKRVLEANGLETDKMIELRRKIHAYPEGGFAEFVTQKTLLEKLEELGVPSDKIKKCAGTGLVVDIYGTGSASKAPGAVTSVALRADMDGLPIPENNQDLPYKTTTDFAHMCGHDGHMATIMSVIQVLMVNIEKVPSD